MFGTAGEEAEEDPEFIPLMMTDHLPLPLRINVAGGIAHTLLPEGVPLPWRTKFTLTTSVDNQPSIDVTLTLGERPLTSQNIPMGTLSIVGLKPMPKGFYRFDLELDINSYGRVLAVLRQTFPVDNLKKDWGMHNYFLFLLFIFIFI